MYTPDDTHQNGARNYSRINRIRQAANCSTPFRTVVQKAKPANAERLKSTASFANSLAKVSEGQAKATLYATKSKAITRLVEMRMTSVGEILFDGEPIVGLWFEGGGGLHVRFKDLSPRGQDIVLQQMKDILPIVNNFSK